MTSLEPLLFIGIIAGLFFATTRFTEGAARAFTLTVLGMALLWGGLAARRRDLTKQSSVIGLVPADSGALGSGACRSCHPSEHVSWHRTFHRTMTEHASARTAKGPWDGVSVEADGRSVELSRRGDELWLRLPDPDVVAAASRSGMAAPSAGAPLVARRVVLTTGSHHEQAYWVEGSHGELRLAPITYLIADRRYVARSDAFLQPPDAAPHAMRWNSNCIQCHATRGEPRLDERTDVFASSAAELGIACEACHGPGAAHVRAQQNPVTRFFARVRDAREPNIVNPARLEPARASEVCGQCHAYFVPRDEDAFWTRGYDYRPGDALEHTRRLLAPDDAGRGLVDAAEESLFWGDGTIRVGGREWNGLARSACFVRGRGEHQISCLSCHSMHESEPDDQLRRGGTDAPCVKCHQGVAGLGSKHTHHAAGSAGSSCVNCHMPFTSYALFKSIRSHRIDSPSAVATAERGRPNACNLCHLDRTLAWTAERLDAWYGPKPAEAKAHDAFASTTARAVEELIAGDAATRAVVAAAFGRADAQAASGADWEAPLLAELLDDPYAAVRKVAGGALATLPGYADVPYDFVASAEQRREVRRAVLDRAALHPARRPATALPLDKDGRRDDTRLRALLAGRDQHPITISE